MHPALQRRRRHLMMTRRTTRRGVAAPRPCDIPPRHARRFRADVRRLDRRARRAACSPRTPTSRPTCPTRMSSTGSCRPQSTLRVRPHRGACCSRASNARTARRSASATLPDIVWQATVASEDRTFWENNGVDFQGVVRAALANLEAGEIVQGASTITQQVIDYARVLNEEGVDDQVDPSATPEPSVGGRPGRTGDRPEEEPRTSRMSASRRRRTTRPTSRTRSARTSWPCRSPAAYPGRVGKERILETYLNLIYYGNGSYGIQAAAANYFGLTDLDGSHRFAGRLPGGTAAGAVVPRPLPEPERRARHRGGGCRCAPGAQSRPRRDAGGGLHHRAQAHEARATTWLAMEPEPHRRASCASRTSASASARRRSASWPRFPG